MPELDTVVEQLKREQSPTDIDLVARDLANERRTMLRSSIFEALQSNPDTFARARELEAQTNIPASVIERNLETVERQARVAQIDKHLQELPVLTRHMLDPGFAKLAIDDGNLEAIERITSRTIFDPALDTQQKSGTVDAVIGALNRAVRSVASAPFHLGASLYGVGEAVSEQLATVIEPFARWRVLPANPARDMAQFFRELRKGAEATAGQVRGFDPAALGLIEQSVYSGLESAAQNIPALVAGVLLRNPELALTSVSALTFGREYGLARDRGIDSSNALIYAVSQAVVEYATERIPVSRLLDDLEKQTGFLRTLAGQVIPEVPQEQVATLLQDLNQWAVLHPDQPFSAYLAERPNAALETLIATAVAVGTQTSVISTVNALVSPVERDRARANLADANARRLMQLAQAAAESKLRARAPDTFEQFVQQAAEEGGELSEVYVEARALGEVLQQAGIEPDVAAPSIAEQYREALAVGGDVRIPVGEFAAHLAGTPVGEALLPHLRLSPEAMSAAEAATFNQQVVEAFRAEAERAIAQQEENAAYQQSVAFVENTLREELSRANRFTADVNNAYAALMRDFYVVTAQRLGITPDELYRRYPLRITATPVTQGLEQLAPEQFEIDDSAAEMGEYVITGRDESGAEVAHMQLSELDEGTLQIKLATVHESRRGEGIGQQLIQQAYELAQREGKRLVSDRAVSRLQLHVYEALRRRGWTIEYNPRVFQAGAPTTVEEALRSGTAPGVTADGPVVTRIEPPATVVDEPVRRLSHVADLAGEEGATGLTLLAAGVTSATFEQVPATDIPETIEVDGVERPTRNSNGQLIHPTEEGIRNFWRWFGDSKVVDEQGRPLVVYHATSAPDFEAFKRRPGDIGIHFGTAGQAADRFSYIRSREGFTPAPDEAPRTIPVYLSIRNPLRLNDLGSWFYDNLNFALRSVFPNYRPLRSVAQIRAYLKRRGYDGIVYKNEGETAGAEPFRAEADAAKKALYAAHKARGKPAGVFDLEDRATPEYQRFKQAEYNYRRFREENAEDSWIAFEPEQIKSALGNRGTFDPSSPNILEQEARGQISSLVSQGGGATIALLQNADLSTFLHEAGHFFLEVYADLAARPDTPQPVRDDFLAVLKWFGVESVEQWQRMTLEERRPHHEQFARGFEAYLFEGQAPNQELRGLFARFRAWLTAVYRSLLRLNVQLTDEVRAVMGRMVASEESIRAAEAARQFTPLFVSAAEASMTEQEWQDYQNATQAATERAIEELQRRSLRDMRWASRARSRILRELQKDVEAKRKVVREEVEREVRAEPVYQAIRYIARGEIVDDNGEVLTTLDEHRLDIDAIEQMYPTEAVDVLIARLRERRLVKRGGVHPDLVAEMFGFTSADHLIQSLNDAPPIDDVIDAVTDQRMLETYGDLTDAKALERAADEAVHNAARARFVATELRALNRIVNARVPTPRGGSVNITIAAAREFAETTIARRKIRELRPSQYAAAEVRAARAAERALADGNVIQAAAEKRNQLVNTYAVRAAYDAQREVERGLTYLRKFSNEGTRKKLDRNYLEQIDALLERFDLRRGTSAREAQRRKSLLEWVEAQRELGFEPVIDEDLLAEARRLPFREMTVEEFRGLVDTVKNIEHLGRLKKRLLTDRQKREFEQAVEQAVQSIEDNARKTIPEELERNAFGARLKEGVQEFFAMHRKFASIVRQLDGFQDGGTLWELFVRPLNEAGDREAVMREQATKKLTTLFRPILRGVPLREKLYIPAIGRSLSREARLSIALNWGNETNRRRVMDGEKWTEAQVRAILDTLTKEEWDFVQSVWDFIGSYWPQIADKEERVTGLRPERVEATPVQTKFGEYRGGYYPIKYDPTRSSRAEADTMAETLRQAMQGLYTRATTRRGHTKARVDTVQGRPLRKDLGVVFEHVEQVIHDLAFHEYLIDANRLLRSPAIDRAIRDHHGAQFVRQMRNALDDIARGDIPAQNVFERSLNWLRTGATIAGLGWNLTTAMLQPIGLTQSMVRIGPKWVGRGLSRWLGSPTRMQETVEWIYSKSDFMRLRAQTMQREISEIRNRVRGDRWTRVDASFFYLIRKFQLAADIPTWLGAYEKAMEQFDGDEAKAIALADQAVLDAQGGGQIKDLAAVQRGGPLMKLWTIFYSYFNTTLNLTAESFRRTDFRKPSEVGLFAADMLLLYTVPATLAALLREVLAGGGDDDDEELVEAIIRENLSYMLGTMILAREMGSVVSGFSYRGPAGLRGLQELSRLLEQAQQGEADEAFWKALNAAAGILFHYPASQVERTAEGVAALAEGDTESPAALVVGVKD